MENKKQNSTGKTVAIIILVGLILIGTSVVLMFGNSNKKLILNDVDSKINDLEKEIDNLVIQDKLASAQVYEVKISELRLKVNELNATNYDMYKDKDISLYDYLMNSKKLKKYEERLKNIEQKLTEKLK